MQLPDVEGEIKFNYNLKNLTWFKVGGPAEILFIPKNTLDLKNFLSNIKNQYEITVLGACSNIIIRDGGIDGVVIKLSPYFNEIKLIDNGIKVGAGCLNFSLANFAKENGISGLEFLTGIPGTVGGGVAMNAGCYGSEYKDIILSVEAIDYNGNLFSLSLEEINFKHRGNNLNKNLIFLSATFKANKGSKDEILSKIDKISQARSKTQPIKEKTGGSTFVNPDPSVSNKKAWELIDEAGMRGYKLGGAAMSELHCNFMINNDNATAADLENLGNLVIDKVFEKSGVKLNWEIKRIGKKL